MDYKVNIRCPHCGGEAKQLMLDVATIGNPRAPLIPGPIDCPRCYKTAGQEIEKIDQPVIVGSIQHG